MSNPYTGAVASALRKSQLLLEGEGGPALRQAAVQEGAMVQLWRAYRAFLCELAFQLQLGCEPESASELKERAVARGMACAEAVELLELLGDPGSWLSQLQAAWLQLWKFSGGRSEGNRGGDNLIPLQNLSTAEIPVLNEELLQTWRGALEELVRRQRAHMEEW
ncbi:DUF6586 family protein [Microbulbifer rhizosphaerae]|uniref:PasA protein n=1 Tax=Microbulbifer rhizosphaerae TaxID=1562603 RepID=A0A7W4WBY5_9GAMM|nr:DUF6586 family protein [Microbulbifer rhizosphaerae]MBB3061459.1 hypothetical protein [Microbulbifer rhizosphaerae]